MKEISLYTLHFTMPEISSMYLKKMRDFTFLWFLKFNEKMGEISLYATEIDLCASFHDF